MQKIRNIAQYTLAAVVLIVSRLLPHEPNFTPVGAFSMITGKEAKGRLAFIVPVVIMLISDYALLYINPFRRPVVDFSEIYSPAAMFHSTTLYVYLSIVIAGGIGMLLKRNHKPGFVIAGSLVNSIQFFIITNFGTWLATNMYAHNLPGLAQAYVNVLPFFKGTLFGDLVYTFIFFGAFALLRAYKKHKQVKSEVAGNHLLSQG